VNGDVILPGKSKENYLIEKVTAHQRHISQRDERQKKTKKNWVQNPASLVWLL
jgi:hypothetical protein